MYVHSYNVTAAGNSISSQLGSSCQGNRYSKKRQAVRPVHHIQNHACRVTLLQPCWASPLAFGLIGCNRDWFWMPIHTDYDIYLEEALSPANLFLYWITSGQYIYSTYTPYVHHTHHHFYHTDIIADRV